MRQIFISLIFLLTMPPHSWAQFGADAVVDQTNVQKNVMDTESFKHEALKTKSDQFSDLDLGLYPISSNLLQQIEILWQMGEAASAFNQVQFNYGPWKEKKERSSFILYHANSFKPRVRVFDYLGRPTLYPSLQKILTPKEILDISLASPDPRGFQETDPIARKVLTLQKTKTYRSKRMWEKKGLEKNVRVLELFQNFENQSSLEETLLEIPISAVPFSSASDALQTAQNALSPYSIYRLKMEGDLLKCTRILPSISELQQLMSQAPQYDGLTLTDGHIAELLLALGITTRHGVKADAYQEKIIQLKNSLKMYVQKAGNSNPKLTSSIQRLISDLDLLLQTQTDQLRKNIIHKLKAVRNNPRFLAWARKVLPSSKALRDLKEIKFRIKFPIATFLSFLGIAGVLALDLSEASALEANSSSNTTAISKAVSSISQATFWTTTLIMGRMIKNGIKVIPASHLLFRMSIIATLTALTLDVAHAAVPDFPATDDVFDFLGMQTADGNDLIRKLRNKHWAEQDWNKLIKLRELRRILPEETEESLEENHKYEVFRLTPEQFSYEINRLHPSFSAEPEIKNEIDKIISKYANGYLKLLLATLQQLGDGKLNSFLLGLKPEWAAEQFIEEEKSREKVLKKLSGEINQFIQRVKTIAQKIPQNPWDEIPGNTWQERMKNHILRVAYELKIGGTYQRLRDCSELADKNCWQLIANPNFHPTVEQNQMVQRLLQAYKEL